MAQGKAEARAWIAGGLLLALVAVIAALLTFDPELGTSLLRASAAKLLAFQPTLPDQLPVIYAGIRG